MTMILKFDGGNTIIKHEAFSEGVIIGIATIHDNGELVEQEPVFAINGFLFAYSNRAFSQEGHEYHMEDNTPASMREFEDTRKYIGNYLELGLNNVPKVRFKRSLEALGVGPDAKAYIKALVESTKK